VWVTAHRADGCLVAAVNVAATKAPAGTRSLVASSGPQRRSAARSRCSRGWRGIRPSLARVSRAPVRAPEAPLDRGRRASSSRSRTRLATPASSSNVTEPRKRSIRRSSSSRSRRSGRLLHRRVLQLRARGAARGRTAPEGADAGFPEEARDPRWDRRGDRDPELCSDVGRSHGARLHDGTDSPGRPC
jgi:hypothetical protein